MRLIRGATMQQRRSDRAPRSKSSREETVGCEGARGRTQLGEEEFTMPYSSASLMTYDSLRTEVNLTAAHSGTAVLFAAAANQRPLTVHAHKP